MVNTCTLTGYEAGNDAIFNGNNEIQLTLFSNKLKYLLEEKQTSILNVAQNVSQ